MDNAQSRIKTLSLATYRLADRMSRLGTESAFEVLARAKKLEAQGKHIIHLQIGEPDFDTPANVVEAGIKALREGWTHYGPAAGLPQLREAVAAEMRRTRGIEVAAENVVVFPGAKPCMSYLLEALIQEGDEVIYPNPGFPIYESMIRFTGGKAVPLPLLIENDFSFDVDAVEARITPKTRLLIINSPGNPTGGVVPRRTIEAVARLCIERNIFVLSDEIYSRVLYQPEYFSITQVPGMLERTCILDGFSKTYSMTGWRLGYGVMPTALAERLTQLAINYNSCVAGFTQLAGVEALTGDQSAVRSMVTEFDRRRKLIVAGLNAIKGVRCLEPRGAFYVFPSIVGTGMKARELADRLLNEAGVAVLPGTSFGAHGEGHLRLSFANSAANLELALERMRGLLGGA